jgi:tRNA pseudouridine55 synthase
LLLALGPATRVLDAAMDMPKCYVAEVRLGATSATDDAEGPLLAQTRVAGITEQEIQTALCGLLGYIEQRPPAYAAIKVSGQPAYGLARRGDTVALAPRPVTIYGLSLLRLRLPYMTLAVWCSKGTYIRALARDLGAQLGAGAYLAGLLRASVGPFHVRDALSLDQIATLAAQGQLAEQLYPPETALAGQLVLLACAQAAADLAHGRAVHLPPSGYVGHSVTNGGRAAGGREETATPRDAPSWALGPHGRMLALGDLHVEAVAGAPAGRSAQRGPAGLEAARDTLPNHDGGNLPRGRLWRPRRVFAT